jgi:prepilin-type N-terminal cleavage/methylation domain-containing protein
MSRIVVAENLRSEDPTDGRDRGFTLVELLVSIGIFALLMALVSVFMVTGLSALRDASTANSIQAQQQNAVIEMSRQVRYIDNPVPKGVGQPAIFWASPDRMVFF